MRSASVSGVLAAFVLAVLVCALTRRGTARREFRRSAPAHHR